MKKYLLELIVFISGAVVMILELVGSRVLAPYVGTSLPVWTSLIGIILASLSLGYFLGGRWADKSPSYKNLSLTLFLAAIAVGLVAVFNATILAFIETLGFGIALRSVIAALVLFTPATFLLGIISPYAVRLRINTVATSGRAVGNLYAVSTAGSILGTFLAGFVLIAYFGTVKILYLLAITLFVIALLAERQNDQLMKIGLVVVAVGLLVNFNFNQARAVAAGHIDTDSQYNRIEIYDRTDTATGKLMRVFLIGREFNSAMFLEGDDLVFEYTKFYRLAEHFKPEIKKTLMLGGGGYSYPKDFLKNFPAATMDVIEIDPKVTMLARKYFRLPVDPRLRIIHEDGRTFLNRNQEKYDVIYGDAFGSFFSIPYQLTTLEAVQKMADALPDDGLVLVNIISTLSGERSKFLRAEHRTFREVFPQVYLFPVERSRPFVTQNVMLVALKSEAVPNFSSNQEELSDFLGHKWEGELELDLPVLTDDFAPVDQYIAALAY